jgi:hypothetical protein
VCPIPYPTGTDADLRKLPHARAGELLRTKFNMSAEEVDALGRWARIDAIRTKCRCVCVCVCGGGGISCLVFGVSQFVCLQALFV